MNIEFPSTAPVAFSIDSLDLKGIYLYTMPGCYYCHKVITFLRLHQKEIPTKDVKDLAVRKELIENGGKGQVPCLYVDGVYLYESDAIIQWLENHLDSL